MKQLLALLLAAMTAITVTACGESGDTPAKDTNQTEPSQLEDTVNASQNNNEPAVTEQADEALTPESFLKLYGFSADEIKPAHFVSFDDVSTEGGQPGEIGSSGFLKINVEPGATTADDYNAWLEGIYSKLCALSVDGKLYKSYLLDEEATSVSTLREGPVWEILPGFGPYFYQYDLSGGKSVVTFTARYDTQKDVYSLGIVVWGPAT